MVKLRSTPRLLVVEDEKNVGTTLVERLKKEGFEVNWATSVPEAKLEIQNAKFDLVLLDVGLPGGRALWSPNFLKKTSPSTALIFLTAYGTPEERVRGLEMGAEDYIVKPFHLKELLLRVQNVLKRASHLSEVTVQDVKIGKARINFSKYLVAVEKNEHTLTHKECALLKLLVDRKGAVVSRDEILNYVWSESEFPTPRTVDNFILRLRKLIEQDPEHPKHIKSIRGVGYQLDLMESPMNLFQKTLRKQNQDRPPVWFMRQAGRYHAHYQNLKATHSFLDICKIPEVSAEAAMGPLEDFGFDAAILFSDLLFPLEAMGMGLTYEVGPKLSWHLREKAQLSQMAGGASLLPALQFQADCMRKLKSRLPSDKGLLGFVGGPLTLYCYAVEGSHAGSFESAIAGFTDGRFHGFCEKLLPLLARNMAIQAEAGADTVAILDTCAGEFDAEMYQRFTVPALKTLVTEFKKLCPNTPVVYYSKKTGPAHWKTLEGISIEALGIDWNHDLANVLQEWGEKYAIQGNIDPNWLFLESADLEARLRRVFAKVKALPQSARRGWICGLGHGVLPKTPESNVRLFLKLQREIFE